MIAWRKPKIYLMASRNHYTCVVREEDRFWVEKDNGKTHPIVNLTQFLNARNAAGAVYRVGDQSTETRFDQKKLQMEENDLRKPQLKRMNHQEKRGKVQPPENRKLMVTLSNQVKGHTGTKQHPNRTKTRQQWE